MTKPKASALGAVDLAVELLDRLAEDFRVPPSYRVRARSYLKTLRKPAPRRVVEPEPEAAGDD